MKKTRLLVVSALAVSGILVSCGGTSNPTTSTPATETPTTETPTTETPTTEAPAAVVASIKDGSGDKSKQELGTDYGMSAAKNNDEAYVQMDNWTKKIQGKTVADVKAATIEGTTIKTEGFTAALEDAFGKKAAISATEGTVKVGVGMVKQGVKAKAATETTPAYVEVETYIAGSAVVGDKVVGTAVDCLTFDVTAGEEAPVLLPTAKYTGKTEGGQAVVSKLDLGEAYGINYKKSSDAVNAYFNGKTLTEVAAYDAATKPEGCTVTPNGLVAATQEAAAFSQKDVITAKPQEGKAAIDNSGTLTGASTLGVGYFTSWAAKGQLDVTVVVAVFDAENKVVSARADVTQYAFQQA